MSRNREPISDGDAKTLINEHLKKKKLKELVGDEI